MTPSSRNAAPAVSPRGTRSSGRLQDGGAAWLQRVRLACLLRCLVAVCAAARLLRTRLCVRALHRCKRQLAQLLRQAAAAKCPNFCGGSPTAHRTFPNNMPATRLRHGLMIRSPSCCADVLGLGARAPASDPTGSECKRANINFFDLSVNYRQSMAAAAPWLAVPAAGTRHVTAQASMCECLQQVRLRPGSQVQTELSTRAQWLYIHAAGGSWVRRVCTPSAKTQRPRGGGPTTQQAGRRHRMTIWTESLLCCLVYCMHGAGVHADQR